MKKFGLIALAAVLPLIGFAKSWDEICSSSDYYHGIGFGTTVDEAKKAALADLAQNISVKISSDFTQVDDVTDSNGELDHNSRVHYCVNSYSNAAFTNVQSLPPLGKEPDVTMRVYIHRDEITKAFDQRRDRAQELALLAGRFADAGKVDLALQHYYWAYSLARSLQYPIDAVGTDGFALVNTIPSKIDEILSDIDVQFVDKDEEMVDLFFTYKGQPVSSLAFNYSDGRVECRGDVHNGLGYMTLSPDYDPDAFHINIEYEHKGLARGVDDVKSVLDILTPRAFPHAKFIVSRGKRTSANGTAFPVLAVNNAAKTIPTPQEEVVSKTDPTTTPAHEEAPKAVEESLTLGEMQVPYDTMKRIIATLRSKYRDANADCFTLDGLEIYNKLIGYGNARIVGEPDLQFFKSTAGGVVVRGLQMSFSFDGTKKKTFVEDVIFTFNADKKIDNISFGIGTAAECEIMGKPWPIELREQCLEFMENYKTAYCLKRYDYISSIFADDAIIIVGNKIKRAPQERLGAYDAKISTFGNETFEYNRMNKTTYLQRLKKSFAGNEFINIQFTNCSADKLFKFDKEDMFAVQIGQQYTSSRYADMGYLFLLVDMTDRDEPLIKIRTWQPHEVPLEQRYNAGDFTK